MCYNRRVTLRTLICVIRSVGTNLRNANDLAAIHIFDVNKSLFDLIHCDHALNDSHNAEVTERTFHRYHLLSEEPVESSF